MGRDEASEAGRAGSCRALGLTVKDVGSHGRVLSRGVASQLNTFNRAPW